MSYSGRQIWTPQTARAVDLAVRTFPYRDLSLRDLTHAHIEQWIKTMHDAGLAPATIRTRVANIRAVLYAAVRDGLIDDNPAVGVRLPRATGRATTTVMPSRAQVAALVRHAPAPYDLLFALCAYAGLRLGEARALRWEDVDLERRVIAVRRQLRLNPGGGSEESPPKYDSYRTVPVDRNLYTLLRRRRPQRSGLVLVGPGGTPLHPGSIHRAWTREKADCRLPDGMRLHDLRHFYASTQVADGVDVLTLQRRLGHANATTTLDVYGHVIGRTP